MGALIKLYDGATEYVLSDINRAYERGYDVAGDIDRADNGTLNVNLVATKTVHTIAYGDITYGNCADGGRGLADLEALMKLGHLLTLIINDYGATTASATVFIDPAEFRPSVQSDGWGREYWALQMVLREK